MDTGEPGLSKCKKPKLSIEYFMEDEYEEMFYNSDEDFDESLLVDKDEEDFEKDSERAENDKQWVKHEDEEGQIKQEEVDIKEVDIKLELGDNEAIIWSDIPHLQSFSFQETNELFVPLPGNKPVDIFNLLVDDTFYQQIVDETNAYAEEVMLEKGFSDYSRISRWKPVTVDELKIFFGLILHTGTINLSRLNDYWRTDPLFNIACFRESMGRDRFLLILRCLHFARNPKKSDPKPDDRLFKIRPLIDYFNNKMAGIYYPGKNLFIDEAMVLWGGKTIFEQFVPNKRNIYGIKFYMLTEPNGLILKFLLYAGCLEDFEGSRCVILDLLHNRLDKGHSVYINNAYNSYSLSLELLERKTHSTGILQVDSKHFPENIKNKKLKKGETIASYANGIMIGKWHDKRNITYISTEFINNLQKYSNRKGIEKDRPLPVIQYSKNMGRRDRQNQDMPYYPCQGKTMQWYKKSGIHIYHLLLLNSFYIYKKYVSSTISFYDFRLEIIRYLLPKKPHHVTTGTTHCLTYCPKSAEGKTLRRKCKYCSDNGVRKDSSFMCKVCKVGFCMEPCFELFHQN